MTFASRCTGRSVRWSGAIGGIISNTNLTASIAIDDTIDGVEALGGIIGYAGAGTTATLINCIGKVVLPATGVNIGIIAGKVDGTVNG